VYLNFSTSLANKNVFNNVLFRSLEATYGGAIFTYADVSIKNCKFVNNSALNSQGNDVYVGTTSGYLGQDGSVVDSCSMSQNPKILLLNGVLIIVYCIELKIMVLIFFT
jgi:hypothetical protein